MWEEDVNQVDRYVVTNHDLCHEVRVLVYNRGTKAGLGGGGVCYRKFSEKVKRESELVGGRLGMAFPVETAGTEEQKPRGGKGFDAVTE